MPKIVHGVDGHLYREEAVWLLEIPAKLGSGIYVNLGTWKGRSAILLAAGLRDNGLTGKVIAVDTYDSCTMTNGAGENTLAYVKEKVEERDLNPYVQIEIGLTSQVVSKYKETQVNFIFIDADHSYEAVKEDFELWSPLIKKGGILAFHDSTKPGVKKFLAEFTGWDIVERIQSLTYYTRANEAFL